MSGEYLWNRVKLRGSKVDETLAKPRGKLRMKRVEELCFVQSGSRDACEHVGAQTTIRFTPHSPMNQGANPRATEPRWMSNRRI